MVEKARCVAREHNAVKTPQSHTKLATATCTYLVFTEEGPNHVQFTILQEEIHVHVLVVM